jgi:Zn-dependent protease
LTDLIFTIVSFACVIISLVVHEFSHGYAALLMGDPTAKEARRLTLNPLAHIDPFGTVVLPLMLVLVGLPAFGYAKPVPYNPYRLKNRKVGEVVVGLAGPMSNLVLALLAAALSLILRLYFPWSNQRSLALAVLFIFGLINLCMMFFNLLPIPPLDGSKLIALLIPAKSMPVWYRLQTRAFPILMIVLVVIPGITGMLGVRFDPVSFYIEHTAVNLSHLLFGY